MKRRNGQLWWSRGERS